MSSQPRVEGDVAIVASKFNPLITDALVEGALATLAESGVSGDRVRVIRVPGAFEIPIACQWSFEAGAVGVIALGCVIRGGTPHFEYVAGEVAAGCNRVSLDYNAPVAFGVLTTDNLEQAQVRATGLAVPAQHHPGAAADKDVVEGAPTHGNKGCEAAAALVEMLLIRQSLEGVNDGK